MKNRGKLQKEVAFNLELGNSMNVEKCAFQIAVPSSAMVFPKNSSEVAAPQQTRRGLKEPRVERQARSIW